MEHIITYHSNGLKSREYFVDDEGLVQGESTTYYENGLPKAVTLYKDNSVIGPVKTWYHNGHLQKVIDRSRQLANYQHPYTEYNSSGFIVAEFLPNTDNTLNIYRSYCGTSKNVCVAEQFTDMHGRRQGKSILRYNSGLLQTVSEYVNGQLHGDSIQYYDTAEFNEDNRPIPGAQVVQCRLQYHDGEKHGHSTEYHRNGEVYRKVTYVYGVRVDTYQEFAANGNLTYECTYNRNGSLVSYEKRFATNTGLLIYHRILDSEQRTTEEHKFHHDGSPIESTYWEYRGYSKFIKEIKKYEKGNLSYHITYDHSIPKRVSYTELEYNPNTGFRKAINEVRNTEESSVSLKFHFSLDGKPRRISLIVDGVYQTTDFKKLLKKKTSEIDDSDIAYIKLTYF